MDEKKYKIIVMAPPFLALASIVISLLAYFPMRGKVPDAIRITLFFIGWAISVFGLILTPKNKKRNSEEKSLFRFGFGLGLFSFICHLAVFLLFAFILIIYAAVFGLPQ